jgi:hypothetical protein
MSEPRNHLPRDLKALRYLDALEAGELEAVAALWEEASGDPELERLLAELDEALFLEAAEANWEADAERVRALLPKHLPSGFVAPEPPATPTVGDVAARLQVDILQGDVLLGTADREVNARLLGSQTPLPEQLGQRQLEQWTAGLGVQASAQYWRAFRQAAVLLKMARCQTEGSLAAARRSTPPRQGGGS